MTQVVQTKLLCYLCRGHRLRQVLLVGEDQEHCISHLVLVEHFVQLLSGIFNAVTVIAVHHVDQAIGSLVVMAPQRTDLVLASDIPNGEAQVLVLDGLDIETNGWDGGHHLTELQLVENGRLTGRVQSYHENSHLLLSNQALPYFGERKTHGASLVGGRTQVQLLEPM
eukprot:Skav227550  [mRNA]  locus=scaffold3241:16004:27349:- [translate_table: standard]